MGRRFCKEEKETLARQALLPRRVRERDSQEGAEINIMWLGSMCQVVLPWKTQKTSIDFGKSSGSSVAYS